MNLSATIETVTPHWKALVLVLWSIALCIQLVSERLHQHLRSLKPSEEQGRGVIASVRVALNEAKTSLIWQTGAHRVVRLDVPCCGATWYSLVNGLANTNRKENMRWSLGNCRVAMTAWHANNHQWQQHDKSPCGTCLSEQFATPYETVSNWQQFPFVCLRKSDHSCDEIGDSWSM